MSQRSIDLRSDTVTLPTDEMYDVMRHAPLGDDNWRDDPTVHELEALAAKMTGHEAALFCPTGTMANLLGTRLFAGPGAGVVMPQQLNMYRYGVIAWNALQPLFPATAGPYPSQEELADAVEWGLAGETPPALIVIEMPHNYAGGPLPPPDYLDGVRQVAQRFGLPFYLDGARVFNAAIASGRPVSDFTLQADATMFCLSKGLSAPVGSMLCSSKAFIERATRMRFLMGGAMRQAGILAACGIFALQHLVERLAEDHENAQLLAQRASAWGAVRVEQASVDTNMVYLNVAGSGMDAGEFSRRLEAAGVLAAPVDPQRVRFVTHRGITAGDVERTAEIIGAVLQEVDPPR